VTTQSTYRVKHRLPHRVRIDFGERLSPEQLRSVIWLLEHHDPGAVVRPAASGHGLVICSTSPDQPLIDPLPRLDQVLCEPVAHLIELPPQGLQKLIRQSRQGTLKLLITLAIAGWALPILPGTPFFPVGLVDGLATGTQNQHHRQQPGGSGQANLQPGRVDPR